MTDIPTDHHVPEPAPYHLPRTGAGAPAGATLATLLVRLRDAPGLRLEPGLCALCETRRGTLREVMRPTRPFLARYAPEPGPDGRVVRWLCRPCSRIPPLRTLVRSLPAAYPDRNEAAHRRRNRGAAPNSVK